MIGGNAIGSSAGDAADNDEDRRSSGVATDASVVAERGGENEVDAERVRLPPGRQSFGNLSPPFPGGEGKL